MADSAERPRPPPNRRRDKAQLSCHPCRQRKLRCDRQVPCEACSRRGASSSCTYAAAAFPSSKAQRSGAPRPSGNVHGRIAELEGLVLKLMNGQATTPSPAAATESPREPSPSFTEHQTCLSKAQDPHKSQYDGTDPGTLKASGVGTSYVQSIHWEAVLDKIRGLKDDLVTFGIKAPPGSLLFYGSNRHATRDEILATVPSRQIVDRLMALHFDSHVVTPYIVHGKKFLREYEAFWDDPSETPIAWVGLLFSMLCISVQLRSSNVEWSDGRAESLRAESQDMKETFREKAMQCLVLARYTIGGPYILETLITVLTGEFILSTDSGRDGWLFMSVILHLAMRMGLHRDPDHFPGISPFEGEMRRRTWNTILQMDLSLSLEMGLPRSATDTHIDTRQPRNLLDSDFDEDTTELPPSRPETEWTPMLPLICRARLISALGLICDVNTNVRSPSYEEVAKVDAILEGVHKRTIPPLLRWDSLPHPITDSPELVVQRVSVETTYHKARILLYRGGLFHRRSRHRDWNRHESVRICLDSALKIISFQQMLDEESQPFGRLHQLRWKIIRILNQDVLLATSILCLYLQDVDKFEGPAAAGGGQNPPRADEIRQRLTLSHQIWLQASAASAEAGKVAKALSIVLGDADEGASAPTTTEAGDGAAYDFGSMPDLESLPFMHDVGSMFNDQYFPSGLYSPLTFFDSVVDSRP